NRCKFFVDTNNLINPSMINPILDKIDEKSINRLNEVFNGIKFYIGGNHWHLNDKGYLKFPAYEFNFNNKTLLIFLSKIFEFGYNRWTHLLYGALKRYVWESFCHEVIMSLVHMLKLNLSLIGKAKSFFLNENESDTKNFVNNLFDYDENFPLRVQFIMIHNKLWNEPIPKNLGFLNVLYNRRINQLKNKLSDSQTSNFRKTRIFNELRKIKLNYKFEYSLSELVSYCIHSEPLEIMFKHNKSLYNKIYNNFYYKGKRIILKFFKNNNIEQELREYKDKLNRKHLFLTYKTFERVKSVCLQLCLRHIKNENINQYRRFQTFYSKCPICSRDEINKSICEKFYFDSKYGYFKEILINKMNEVKSLNDLNDDQHFFGIPCEECFQIIRNISGKFYDLNEVQKFIYHYQKCPLCLSKNHINYLLSFFYDKSKKDLRDNLLDKLNLVKSKHLKSFNVNIGIPCCDCFEKLFGKDQEQIEFI
ncbi:MAG: hypothetical protein ACFFA6_11685, partial [Promethearchaeota archaeon]